MIVREPAVAGRFYAAQRDVCRQELESLLGGLTESVPRSGLHQGTPQPVGGIVPHAGWCFSGKVAAEVFMNLAAGNRPDVIVLFGGVHRHRSKLAALFGSGRWETPLGSLPVATRLAERVLSQTNLIVNDPYAHEAEHSIEVQLPMIAHLFGTVDILPILVPVVPEAVEIGRAVGRTLTSYGYNAKVVGSTDLTHYGPSYGFVPHGEGAGGIQWAKEKNDRRFIDLVCRMEVDGVVGEASQHRNACSSGAVAATMAAANALGATRAELLSHTHSRDVVVARGAVAPADSVGYAGWLLY